MLVDDHILVRKGIASLLANDSAISVVGEADNGLEALHLARQLVPDVILMDIYMPVCDGITATRIIRLELPSVRLVILTASEDEQNLFSAIKSGAQGYVLKQICPRELSDIVKLAARGDAAMSPATAARVIAEFAHPSRTVHHTKTDLTPREVEVLALVAQGLSNEQAATTLALSKYTVRNHLAAILEKLHLKNRVEAATYAVRTHLIPQDEPHEPK